MKPAINLVPIDDLGQAIVNRASRISVETYEMLILIREYDERGGGFLDDVKSIIEVFVLNCQYNSEYIYIVYKNNSE